jgi:hypothetical protein
MLISSGVQWFLLALRKYSQAQGYLNGASWLISVRPLTTRLSSGLIGFAEVGSLRDHRGFGGYRRFQYRLRCARCWA